MAKRRKLSTVGAQAKTHLPRLLADVAAGLTITITKHGRPVARSVPATGVDRPDAAQVIASLRQARHGVKLSGQSLRNLIDKGRS